MSGSRLTHVVGVIVILSLVGCGAASDTPSATVSGDPSAAAASPTPSASESASPTASPSTSGAMWEAAGDLIIGRSRTNVVALGDGSILVVGFDNVCSPGGAWPESALTELGDPLGQVWSEAESLPTPRDRFALAPLSDGRALVTGGTTEQTDTGPTSYSSTYLFDPADGSWSRAGLLNTARSDPAHAVLADGRVLVAGGYFADPPVVPEVRVLDSAELFDPATGEWSPTGALLVARYGASAVTLTDGRVLVVGGWPTAENGPAPLYGGPHRPLASAEIYDPATGRWSAAGELDLARTDFVLVALADGGALVAGGNVRPDPDPSSFANEPTATVERFDPAASIWSPTGDMALAAADRTGIRLPDGRVLVAGGDLTVQQPDFERSHGLTADAELYDPEAGTWAPTTPMPHPRSDASAVLLEDGSVLLLGGIIAHAEMGSTPACPTPDPGTVRYIPAS